MIENWWLKSRHYPVSHQSHTLHNISPRTVRSRTHITPWCYDSSPGHSRRSRKWQEQRSPAPWQSVARGSSRQIWQMDRKCLRLRLIKSFPLEMLSLATYLIQQWIRGTIRCMIAFVKLLHPGHGHNFSTSVYAMKTIRQWEKVG